MYKWMVTVAVSLIVLGNTLNADSSPPCFAQLESQFFNRAAVEQALSLYNVPQGAWQNISNDLQGEADVVAQRVRVRASGMRPDPLSPFNKKAAGDLLRAALYASLVSVLDRYGIRDDVQRQGIYQSLREHNAALLKSCVDENVKITK